MDEVLDIIFNYNRKLVEYNICSEKLENLKKNIEYLKSNEETKVMAETMSSSLNIMNEKIEVLNKEKEELKKDTLNKIKNLNETEKEELLNRIEIYSKMDPTYNIIYDEIKNI